MWVLDGAHTPLAAAALANTILAEFGRPIGVIAGMLKDKHPAPFFAAMAIATAGTIVTTPKNPRAIPAEELLLSLLPVDSQTIASPNLEASLATGTCPVPSGPSRGGHRFVHAGCRGPGTIWAGAYRSLVSQPPAYPCRIAVNTYQVD